MSFLRAGAILGCVISAAMAQNISGGLSGTVVDSLKAPFAGTTVKATNEQTGFVRTTSTNLEGFFAFPDLTPGEYRIDISAPGFKEYVQSGIAIGSGETRALGIVTLQIGETTESVTVTAEAAPVQLGSTERAGTLSQTDIQSMALRGRDLMDAIGLLPGVVDTDDSREAPGPTSIQNLFIAGGRGNSKNMTIDGVTNLDTGSNGSVHSMPSMDSVGEVKVLMSNYAAEHGRNSGGTITVITRGGQKRFHGSAGWFHRHEKYSANTFFNNQRGIERQPYRYNIMSYTLSGPVYIPGKFNRSREKLFFFWSQEFQRQKVGYGSETVRVPTELERAGDFSQSFDLNNRIIQVRDPLNNAQPFPDNVVPASRLTAVGKNILNLFPLPNFVDPEPARRLQWNYISQRSGAYPRRTEIIRTDWSPKQNLQTYLRLSNNADAQNVPYNLWVAGDINFPLTDIAFRQPGRGATFHSTFTISPTLFNQLILGVSQNKLTFWPADPERVSRKGTGIDIPMFNPDLNPLGMIPNMTFGGVSNYANPSLHNGLPYYNANTIFSVVENLSKVHGTHVLKFGVYIERTRKDQSAAAATRGRMAFDRTGANPLDTNHPYANALLGIYRDYSEANARPQGHYRFTNLEFYAQDAWRIRPRLLLDYGVRFYHNMPQYDAREQLATFVPEFWDPQKAPTLLMPAMNGSRKMAQDPVTGLYYPEGLIGTFAPGRGNPANGMVVGGKDGWPRGLYTVPPISVAPRVGFAWDPLGHGRTAIRGGGGVFYDRIMGNPTMGLITNPPTILTPTVYYGTIEGLKDVSTGGILAPSGLTSLIGDVQMPTVYNYSFGIQQQVGKGAIVDVSYVGSMSRHFLWRRNINAIPPGAQHIDVSPQFKDPTRNAALPANFLRPYQGYADIHLFEFGSTSNYNSLQASATKRMRRGYVSAAYTFSKALGTASTDTANVSPFFAPRDRNYGPLNFDRTHVASLRYTYRLPNPAQALQMRPLGWVTDNWEMAGTTRIMSGSPFLPGLATVDGQDITGTGSEGARVTVLDPNAPLTERFGRPARGTFGNAGPNILRGPGTNNWDISAYKNFRIQEGKQLQLRFESYNTFNHTQWSSLFQTARFDQAGAQIDPLFLTPSNSRPPRRVQLAMRLTW